MASYCACFLITLMNAPASEHFDRKAREVFSVLIDRYNYLLTEVAVRPFYVSHIYTNPQIGRRVEITNSTYGSDYGFSFFIYQLGTNEYNILYNVPHEHQDKECRFLVMAQEELFSKAEILDIISGKAWKEFDGIVFKR